MMRRFARPYARAILEVAGSPQKANNVRVELARFDHVRAGSNDLQELYANPGIDLDAKFRVTHAIAAKLGMTELAGKVLEVLIRNHRANDLAAIVDALAEMVNAQLGVVVSDVRSAHDLTEAEIAELRRTLEQKVGRKVEVRVTTDPSLIGGFVAKIGSEVFDASVAGKINKFRQSLM